MKMLHRIVASAAVTGLILTAAAPAGAAMSTTSMTGRAAPSSTTAARQVVVLSPSGEPNQQAFCSGLGVGINAYNNLADGYDKDGNKAAADGARSVASNLENTARAAGCAVIG